MLTQLTVSLALRMKEQNLVNSCAWNLKSRTLPCLLTTLNHTTILKSDIIILLLQSLCSSLLKVSLLCFLNKRLGSTDRWEAYLGGVKVLNRMGPMIHATPTEPKNSPNVKAEFPQVCISGNSENWTLRTSAAPQVAAPPAFNNGIARTSLQIKRLRGFLHYLYVSYTGKDSMIERMTDILRRMNWWPCQNISANENACYSNEKTTSSLLCLVYWQR